MLTQRADAIARFTRSDAVRLAIAAGILILVLTAILGADILPRAAADVAAGDLAPRDIVAPKALDFESDSQTDGRARGRAPRHVAPQYDFTTENAIAHRRRAAARLRASASPGSTPRSPPSSPPTSARRLLQTAVPDLTDDRPGDAARPGRRRAGRSSAPSPRGPRRAPARRAARHRRSPRPGPRLAGLMAGGLDASRAGARRGAHRPARRPQLVVQPATLTDQEQAKARRGGPAGDGPDPPGRGHRPRRRAR